jgi:hypothetical protein
VQKPFTLAEGPLKETIKVTKVSDAEIGQGKKDNKKCLPVTPELGETSL